MNDFFKSYLGSKLVEFLTHAIIIVFSFGSLVPLFFMMTSSMKGEVLLVLYLPFLYLWFGPLLSWAQKSLKNLQDSLKDK